VSVDPVTPRSIAHYSAKSDPALLMENEEIARHNLSPLSCDRHDFMDTLRWIFSSGQARVMLDAQ
jgi:hypothetical protein